MDFEDEKFVEKYGSKSPPSSTLTPDTVGTLSGEVQHHLCDVTDDNTTSGLWELARSIREDNEKVEYLCSQAHERFFGRLPNITGTGFYVKQLTFINSPQFQPMNVDVLVYATVYNYQAPNTPYLFHFTKGLEADCIYYLVPLTPSQLTVQLQEHVCGLKLPFETG